MKICATRSFHNEDELRNMIIVRKQNFLYYSLSLSEQIDFSLIFPLFFLINAAITLLYCKEDEEVSDEKRGGTAGTNDHRRSLKP